MDEALRGERRRRHRLYVIGTAVAVAGIIVGSMPLFAEHTPILRGERLRGDRGGDSCDRALRVGSLLAKVVSLS